jgi:hypothetical protein
MRIISKFYKTSKGHFFFTKRVHVPCPPNPGADMGSTSLGILIFFFMGGPCPLGCKMYPHHSTIGSVFLEYIQGGVLETDFASRMSQPMNQPPSSTQDSTSDRRDSTMRETPRATETTHARRGQHHRAAAV